MVLALMVAAPIGDSSSLPARSDEQTTLVAPPWKHTLGLNRVGQSHLDLYSGYRKKFSNPQGLAATKLQFNDKEGRGDDDELTVYGLNVGTGEIFYNTSMVSLGFFGSDDLGGDGFNEAADIAADAQGNVFVTDRGNDRVIHLRNSDNALALVGAFDLNDSGQPLRSPAGAVVEDGWLYIADAGNGRIVVTGLDGVFHRRVGERGQFIEPFGIAVISSVDWNFFGGQFIVVTDSLNQRLTKLALDGTPLAMRRFAEISGGEGGFYFVAIDYHSNVYVTDLLGGCIYKFDRYLRYLTRLGCGTGSKSDLIEPRGIDIYRRFGQVFVAEKGGASYFWVGTDVQNFSCVAASENGVMRLECRFLLTERSTITIKLLTDDGRHATTVQGALVMPPGLIERAYSLAESLLPCPPADCEYTAVITARATYSSKKYHRVERKTPVRHP